LKVLDIYTKRAEGEEKGEELVTRILQEPGSLLVTTGEAYTELLHGISELKKDENLGPATVANWELLGDRRRFELDGGVSERSTRISLTYRDVLKVRNLGFGVVRR